MYFPIHDNPGPQHGDANHNKPNPLAHKIPKPSKIPAKIPRPVHKPPQ